MSVEFSDKAIAQLFDWSKDDPRASKKILALIADIQKNGLLGGTGLYHTPNTGHRMKRESNCRAKTSGTKNSDESKNCTFEKNQIIIKCAWVCRRKQEVLVHAKWRSQTRSRSPKEGRYLTSTG